MAAFPYEYGDDEQGWKTVRVLVLGFMAHQVDCTHIREPLSTSDVLALMWFFTRVSTDVNGQRTPLNKALATAWGHA